MADTPSALLLLRLQSTGSNTNLWGGYINTSLQTLEQASKGWQTLAVTGNATISWTQYATGNIGQCAHLVMTGALTSPATLIFPGIQNKFSAHNNSGSTITIMCSGGVGVAVPNGRKCDVYCNGTDYFSDTPSWTGDSTILANSGDIPNYSQVQTLIANAGLPATAGTVLNSGTDTTAGYLEQKLDFAFTPSGAVSGNGSWATENLGANEKAKLSLSVSVGSLALTLQALQSASFSATAGKLWPVPVGGTITLPSATGTYGVIGLIIIGAGSTLLSGTVNGVSSLYVGGNQTLLLSDSGSTWGWV